MFDGQLAAVAVCPDATRGALLSVTLVSGPLGEPLLADPIELTLPACTPDAVASAVARTVVGTVTSIVLSLPVALAWRHKRRFEDAIGNYIPRARTSPLSNPALVHFSSDFPDSDAPVHILFLDLSPGHAAAALRAVEADCGHVFYSDPMDEPTMVESDPETELSPQELITKLVTPTINSSNQINPATLHGIYIFRPNGPCSAIYPPLQRMFPATPIKWVSLTEISRTAATMLHRATHSPKPEIMCSQPTVLPLMIALANGRLIPAIPRFYFLPANRTLVATTSEDDQRTATVGFFYGSIPVGTVTVAGIAVGPRGAARIHVSVEMADHGATSVCVAEQRAGGARVAASLPNVLDGLTRDIIDAYYEQHEQESAPYLDEDAEVMGELPP